MKTICVFEENMDFTKIIHINEIMFRHPFNCIISGQSQSGKTVLLCKILNNYTTVIANIGPELRILWVQGVEQDLSQHLTSHQIHIKFTTVLPKKDEITKYNLLVIDDMMNELGNSRELSNLFTKFTHHYKISVFLCLQNLFPNEPVMRTVSLNAHYILLMKNPRDKSQVARLAKQIFPRKPGIFLEAYEDATKEPYSYLRYDAQPKTDERLRLTAKLTPEVIQDGQKLFAPIVYIPKQ